MRTRIRGFLCLLVVCCAGCGGGDGGGGQSAPPPSGNSPNQFPILAKAPTDQTVVAFHPLDYDLTPAFRDPDGDPLTYDLRWSGGAPSGLGVTGSRLTGSTADVGNYGVTLIARDGRGGEQAYTIVINVTPNLAPVVNSHSLQLVAVGAAVSYDPTQASTPLATDPEGDAVTYELSLASPPHGLAVVGTTVTGAFAAPGAVRVKVTASDPFGASSADEFVIAAPAPEPGAPTLPATSFTYDDAKLALPPVFRLSREIVIPLWDTTPADNPTSDAGATLGRVLFYDKRLSATNTHACASCHQQEHGFANTTRFSEGITGELTKRNAMGLTGARYNLRDAYFSDVRVNTLERLALMPIQDHIELGNSLPNVVSKLSATDFYPPLFSAAFGTPEINNDRIAKALAQFLRALISYNSKTDQVENPMPDVPPPVTTDIYTAQELAGSGVFLSNNCFFCHNDTTRSTFDPSNNGIDATITDVGSGGGRFRAASLRNIARTAPYMHDGRFATLRDVVEHYDHGINESPNLDALLRVQLLGEPVRMNLSEEAKEALVAFLNTFTDEQFLTDPRFSDPFQ